MPTRTTRNGVTDEALRDAIVAWRADPTDANESAVLTLYERLTGYGMGCAGCVAERTAFIEGLRMFKDGKSEGLARMKLALQRGGNLVLSKIL